MSIAQKFRNKNKIDYKAKLEHKLYLARESPSLTYDISECNLENVPCSTYILCDVFRKKKLMMQYNKLKTLLNGGTLKYLSHITVLDVCSNKLSNLPSDIIHLVSLKGLHLSYPSEDIQSGGTIIIIAFLANECGINYSPENCIQNMQINSNFDNIQMSPYNNEINIQTTLRKLEKLKEHRQNTLLELEENIKQQQIREFKIQSKLKINKQKFLSDLEDQEMHLQKELKKLQQKKDANRSRLLFYIYNAEKEANNLIQEFLHSSEKHQSHAKLLEIEKKEELQLLSQKYSEQSLHCTKKTLLSMKELLEDELLKGKKFAEYTKFKDNCNVQSLLNFEVKNNHQLLQVMLDQEKNKQDLVIKIRENEQLQKSVVTALLERSDARLWSIIQQVNLIQSELAVLTNIELKKKKLQIEQHINDIADKRITLSTILLNLLEKKEKRRQQLVETMKKLEKQQTTSALSKRDKLFWLLQYQNLLDTRPQGLLKTLDSTLVHYIVLSGALHCLPFLWTLPSLLANLQYKNLKSMGINSKIDRIAIMRAVENYLLEKKLNYSPTLIEEPSTSYSKPKYIFQLSVPTECIVCMDLNCEVIFLPCGHLCCCAICTNIISTECPMCRTIIEHKIRVTNQ